MDTTPQHPERDPDETRADFEPADDDTRDLFEDPEPQTLDLGPEDEPSGPTWNDERPTIVQSSPDDLPTIVSDAGMTLQDFGLDEHEIPTLPPGSRVGKYEIEKVLGVGGMGAVYRAKQSKPHRLVALKLIKAGLMSRKALRRFDLEAEILGRLHHPNIAQIHEAGIDKKTGSPYFAMEYVEGHELTDYADEHRLDTKAKLKLFIKLCDAIQHAHAKGVIHRDLKPGNVLVSKDGEPKVLDFGVARAADDDSQGATLQTNMGQLVGTLFYMSPEQAIGDVKTMDTRSDVYALGVVLYELLTGHIPYNLEQKALHEAVQTIRETSPTKLSKYGNELGGDLEIIVNKALDKDRERRYQTAAEFAKDLQRYLNNEPISARPPSMVYKTTKFVRRNSALTLASVVVLIIASVIGGFAMNQWVARTRAAKSMLQNILGVLNEVDVQKGTGPDLARRLLDQYASSDPSIFSNDPESLAMFYSSLGSAYHGYEDYQRANDEFRLALDIAQNIYDDNDPELAMAHHNIAKTYFFLRDLEQARDHYHHALRIFENVRNPSEEVEADMAFTLDHLGSVHRVLRDPERSFEYYSRAHEIRSRIAPESLQFAMSINNMASYYSSKGELDRAAELFAQAVDIVEQLPEDEEKPLFLARGLHSLGNTLSKLGQNEEAVPLLAQSVELKRILLTDQKPSVAMTLHALAEAEFAIGNLDQAQAHVEEAIQIRRDTFNNRLSESETLLREIRAAQTYTAEQ